MTPHDERCAADALESGVFTEGNRKEISMNPLIQLKKAAPLFFIALRTSNCLSGTLDKSPCSHSRTGRRLSRRQHGGGAERSFEPYHRHLQHGNRDIFASKPHRRQLLHGCRRWDAPCQHRQLQHGNWRRGALEQHDRRRQHCHRYYCAL